MEAMAAAFGVTVDFIDQEVQHMWSLYSSCMAFI
jgi:hypothetical protein